MHQCNWMELRSCECKSVWMVKPAPVLSVFVESGWMSCRGHWDLLEASHSPDVWERVFRWMSRWCNSSVLLSFTQMTFKIQKRRDVRLKHQSVFTSECCLNKASESSVNVTSDPAGWRRGRFSYWVCSAISRISTDSICFCIAGGIWLNASSFCIRSEVKVRRRADWMQD